MKLTPQITLNATQQGISGAVVLGAKLRITLVNYGANIPVVLDNTVIGTLTQDLPFVNGQVSVVLWGNDVISPQGTRYCIQLIDSKRRVVAASEYILNGVGAFDLSVLLPFTPDDSVAQGSIYLVDLDNKGPQGNAGTIEIGTVTEGVTPEITNTGTPEAAVLNFTLPEGPAGPAGVNAEIGSISGNFVMAAALGAIDGVNATYTVQGGAGYFWLVFLNGQKLESGPGYTRGANGTQLTLPQPLNPDGRGPGLPDVLTVIAAGPVTGNVGNLLLIPDEDTGQLYQLSVKDGGLYSKLYLGS